MTNLNNYLVKALYTFHVRTLCSIGYNTRVTLNDSSNNSELNIKGFQIDLSLYDNEGIFLEYISNVDILKKNSSLVIDCKKWQGENKKDRLIIFHMIPLNLKINNNYDNQLNLEKDLVLKLAGTADNYVEYYLENGYSAGLLYQCFPFNYKKFNKYSSTLIQAPKIFINKEIDTLLSLFYSSPSNKLSESKKLNCSILNLNGEVVFSWIENIKPYTTCLISLKNILKIYSSSLSHILIILIKQFVFSEILNTLIFLILSGVVVSKCIFLEIVLITVS